MTRQGVFGVSLDALTMEQTVERCEALVRSGRPAQHVVLNAGKVVMMKDVPGLRSIISNCEIVNADGQSIVWAGRLLGVPVPERVAGIDLMEELLSRAEVNDWPVFFLGATSETLADFQSVVAKRYPKLIVAGARNGYFEDDEAVAEEVRSSGARILFVAISSPRKEQFLSAQLHRLGPVLAMGVGGSFDVWAGKATRAPRWMQRMGLEWLHRLLQEPGRLWSRYLIGNTRFIGLVAADWGRATRATAFGGRLESWLLPGLHQVKR
jgi:N-acetylglucosaminyldiphosphoundecaprenol N-acetyl-beta-D-mannosaminyltransferase